MVDFYWADFLGCEVDLLLNSVTTHLLVKPNQPGLWAITRRGGWVVRVPSGWGERLSEQIFSCFRPNLLPDGSNLDCLLESVGEQQWYGPAAILLHNQPMRCANPARADFQNVTDLCDKLSLMRREVSMTIRPLTCADQVQVAALGASTPLPWSLTQPEIWIKIFGLFVADELVAACGVRVWGDLLAEIYVDTAPSQRRRGYGKAVTIAALQWIHSETPYQPESVVELSNQPSLQLMKSLGFEQYAYMVMTFPVG